MKIVVHLYSRYKIFHDSSSLEDKKNMFLPNVANTQPRGVTFQKTGSLNYCAVTNSNHHGKEMPEKIQFGKQNF